MCCQHGLVDHQLADQIDEPLDALQFNANRLGVFRRCRHVGPLAVIDAARGWGRLRRHAVLSQRHARGCLFARGTFDAVALQREFAFALDEFENLANGLFAVRGMQQNVPRQIGLLGVKILQERYVVLVQLDADPTQALQLAQQEQRLICLGVQFRMRANANGPTMAVGLRLKRCFAFEIARAVSVDQRCERPFDLLRAFGVKGAAVALGLDMVGDHIGGAQHQVDGIGVELDAARTKLGHRGFEDMRERRQPVQGEIRRPALYRMDRSKRRVHDLGVTVAALERQQRRLQLAKEVSAVLKEDAFDLFHHFGR
jgi:hypothetical protein